MLLSAKSWSISEKQVRKMPDPRKQIIGRRSKASGGQLNFVGLDGHVLAWDKVEYDGEFEVYTRIVEGEYFKYKNMFNELPLHTVISRADLLDAMTRAKMCTDEKCPVHFNIEGSSLNLSIQDSTTD